MSDVLVLGPQFRAPVLREAMAQAGIEGRMASVTAGWQEREGELGALEEHLGRPVTDLRLYERTEAVFAADPALHAAYRARQDALKRLQEFYRLRLDHAKAAARELLAMPDSGDSLRRARRAAIGALRRLDREHLLAMARLHAVFDREWHAERRPALASQVAEVRHLLEDVPVVLIAGGHIAVLLNRLRLIGLGPLLRSRSLVAWSAGAMALSDRVVLFHDHPPQGAGNAEVFDAGLGLVPGALFLPQARSRLALGDPLRIQLFARRFAPASCGTLEDGSWMHWHRGRLRAAEAVLRLGRAGTVLPLEAAA